MNADKSITCAANRLNARSWSPLAHRSAFILAYRRQKALASAKPQDVGRDENANVVALVCCCCSDPDHRVTMGGTRFSVRYRRPKDPSGYNRFRPMPFPSSWLYRKRTAAMLRPLGVHRDHLGELSRTQKADIMARSAGGMDGWLSAGPVYGDWEDKRAFARRPRLAESEQSVTSG
jgi:hypothetical protein